MDQHNDGYVDTAAAEERHDGRRRGEAVDGDDLQGFGGAPGGVTIRRGSGVPGVVSLEFPAGPLPRSGLDPREGHPAPRPGA